MYNISVPFMLDQIDKYGAQPFIDELKKIGANIVFLALDCYKTDKDEQEKVFDSLKINVPLFKNAGFTVGVWVWTFMVRGDKKYTHITSPNGGASADQVCPSDKEFCAFAYEYLQNIAKSNPDIMLFDDDFRYGYLDCGLGCTCKNHLAYMQEILGEEIPTENLNKLLFGGSKNKYRSAYLKANGHFLKEFAKLSRQAVDSVNPNIRFGVCACMTTWDFDGVSANELAKILAGNTKPFLRLIGAPYWSTNRNWGNRLQDVIELERMESSWCDDDVEIYAEGDVYPRPRFICPSNVLEGFDMAMRASGATDGIHKYTLDYFSDVNYEQGYNVKHIKNKRIYEQIERGFNDKSPVGVRVYESMTKFENMTVPTYYDGSDRVRDIFFSPAAKMLAAQTIPTVYKGLGTVGIAFSENVKYLDDGALENGLIIDIVGAKILQENGVDVGLDKVKNVLSAQQEYFPDKKRFISLFNCSFYDIEIKNGAKVLSYFNDGNQQKIGSYSYENANGQKFLVFAVDGYRISEHFFKQAARGTQIDEWILSLGKKLPASMLKNPDCYMLCKDNDKERAIWIGNFFADECLNTTILLDKEYSEIEFINCSGKLKADKVELDYIGPFASVGFIVK